MGKFFNTCKLTLQKNSPTILLVGGVIFVVGAAVVACVKTRKLDDTLKETKEELDTIHEVKKSVDQKPEEGTEDTIIDNGDGTYSVSTDTNGAQKENIVYSDANYRKDIVKIYSKAGLNLGKLYWLPVTLGVIGFGMIFQSHSIMTNRYSNAVAACLATDRILSFYRKNVVEEMGEEADQRFRYGLKKETVEKPVLDNNGQQKRDKEGKPKTKEEDVLVAKDPQKTLDYSPYARVFAKYTPFLQLSKGVCYGSREWEDSGFYNLQFIENAEKELERELQAEGHLFLNRAYELLGFDTDNAGQDVGWKVDPDDPNNDCHVKLTILPVGYDPKSDEVQSVIKGGETDYVIDFNVYGNIRPFVWGEEGKTPTFRPFAAGK